MSIREGKKRKERENMMRKSQDNQMPQKSRQKGRNGGKEGGREGGKEGGKAYLQNKTKALLSQVGSVVRISSV